MTKVVLGKLSRLDLSTTLVETKIGESATCLPVDEAVFVLADTEENLQEVHDQGVVYLPSTLLSEDTKEGMYVYFDLENYPFYQRAKEIIKQEAKPKGVFRYRRMVNEGASDLLFASDLYVIASLLGKVDDIKVKRTDQSVTPSHTIVLANFGNGTMAHIEYTVSDHERIELEWSGIKEIIEFDSDEMSPIDPGNRTLLPLMYPVDSILEKAHKVDEDLKNQIHSFKELINGGSQS